MCFLERFPRFKTAYYILISIVEPLSKGNKDTSLIRVTFSPLEHVLARNSTPDIRAPHYHFILPPLVSGLEEFHYIYNTEMSRFFY